ncbi:MAG: AAA family ATPase, partial [candidate division KSB1 bacterium]|nr:AAA family ATPase [candidate division KSB1 bacterium]
MGFANYSISLLAAVGDTVENLEQLLDETRNGNGKIVVISAEADGSKTARIHEFLQQHDQDCLVAIAECRDAKGENLYFPFKQVLAELNAAAITDNPEEKKSTAHRLIKLVADAGPDWIEAIPILGNIVAAGIRTFQAYEKHFGKKIKTYEASPDLGNIRQLYENELRRLAKKAPLLIFLNNLQWADPSSLHLLFELDKSLRIKPFPLLLIGSYDPKEVKIENHSILSAITELLAVDDESKPQPLIPVTPSQRRQLPVYRVPLPVLNPVGRDREIEQV